MHMNYTGSSFVAVWESSILEIECFKVEKDTFPLLEIILDAACKQGRFSLAWDLRKMEQPSFREVFKIISFCSKWKIKLDEVVERTGILTSHGGDKYLTYIFKVVPPQCPYYLGSSYHEWQRFLS